MLKGAEVWKTSRRMARGFICRHHAYMYWLNAPCGEDQNAAVVVVFELTLSRLCSVTLLVAGNKSTWGDTQSPGERARFIFPDLLVCGGAILNALLQPWQRFAPAVRKKKTFIVTSPAWPVGSPSTRFHGNGGERKKQRETEVICLRGTGRGEGDESRRRPARNETASEQEREINTDGESEAVEILFTNLRVSPSPKCRSDADAPVRARPRVSGCGVTRAKATEDERASAGLVEAFFSHPVSQRIRARFEVERGRLVLSQQIKMSRSASSCPLQTTSPWGNGFIPYSVQTWEWHWGLNVHRSQDLCPHQRRLLLHVLCCCACWVHLFFTVAFSGSMAPWIIYATNEFSCRCRCSTEDNQGTRCRRRSHRARLVVEQKSNTR